MALFSYFPNYIWNLSLAIALESGGKIGEIVDMCQPIKEAAESGADAGTGDFMAEWVKMADKLTGLAAEDEQKGGLFSAGEKLKRASLYYTVAERMQGQGHPGRAETYAKALDAFARGTSFAQDDVERVEIPYQGRSLAALLTRAPGDGPKPIVIYCNGLDSTKELLYFSWLPHALAKRGISTLCVDQPGTGEALRLHDIPATHESERWASAWIDWLETQDFVDPARIGMTGISLGGYYAPRAVAYEPRFAAGAVWGANHNWAEVQQKRLRREGENPVPHYWAHVRWVFGARDMDDFLAKAAGMHLDGVMERIRVPFLVTHGEKDRQIALDYAHRSFDQLTASPRRELKIFTDREGGVEHVGADNMAFGRDYIADWFADTLGERMISSSIAQVPTANGSRYLQQVCKHWAHNLDVDYSAERGTVIFPKDARGADWPGDATVTMIAHAEMLECRIDASADGQRDGLKGALARHLDRFAFREAPLAFEWRDQ